MLWALVACGCTVKALPPRARLVERVDIHGAEKVDPKDTKKRMATAATKRLLGGALRPVPIVGVIDAITVEYHTFDRFVLQRDLDRIKRYYRSRGFYDAHVQAARVIETDEGFRVEIVVDEGEPVLIEGVELQFPGWQQAFEANARLHDLRNQLATEPVVEGEGQPRFDEERYDEIKKAMVEALTDRGFAHAAVAGHVRVDLVRRRAFVRLEAEAGPRCTFGPTTIEGLGEIPEGPVRRALGFDPGDEYSTEKLRLARRALADLGVFGSIELSPQLESKGKTRRTVIPVLVTVRPIKLRAVKLGAGAELGNQVETHAIIGWEHRNFLGGLRRFSVETRPGLVFFPVRAETIFTQPPTRVLPEASLELDFKQPGFPEARTNMHVSTGLRIYPPNSNPVPEPVPDEFNIVGYRELDGAFGFDRRFHFLFWGGSTLYVAQFIKVQVDDPFSYNMDEEPLGYEPVRIPYLETVVWWDFRKGKAEEPDPVHPHRGLYFGTNVQFAGGFLQGDASDVRLVPELRAYAPVSEQVTLALRFAVGFLFPRDYGELLTTSVDLESLTPQQQAQWARDLQLLSFRALFSGGPNSNRGYGYREVGPHDVLPFLSQHTTGTAMMPTGGMGLWEAAAELRIPLTPRVGTVVFIDASDVTRTIEQFRVNYPHICPGTGLRVDTPIGPIRFDLGVRVPYLQKIGEKYLEPAEGGPALGEEDHFPVAVAFAIGEAF